MLPRSPISTLFPYTTLFRSDSQMLSSPGARRSTGGTDMATIELLAPVGAVAANAVPLAKRVPTLEGRVVGLLNNSKAATRPFLDRVEELLRSAHGVSRIIRYDKTAAALPVSDAMLEAASRECDVVINGIAD